MRVREASKLYLIDRFRFSLLLRCLNQQGDRHYSEGLMLRLVVPCTDLNPLMESSGRPWCQNMMLQTKQICQVLSSGDKSALNQTPISVTSSRRAPHIALPQTKFCAEVELANLAGRGLRVIRRTLRIDSTIPFPRNAHYMVACVTAHFSYTRSYSEKGRVRQGSLLCCQARRVLE